MEKRRWKKPAQNVQVGDLLCDISWIAGTRVQWQGVVTLHVTGVTPCHSMSPALTLPDPQLLCLCSLSTTGCKPSPPASSKALLERAGNGPNAKKGPNPRGAAPSPSRPRRWELQPPRPRCGMCFLWNGGASQGGDPGPELCVAWASAVLAAVL